MNKTKFFAALCCTVALFAACEPIKTDEPKTANDSNDNTPTIDGHAYVDLGLPSGLKWATCNVGATKPEEYGNYYAWGETIAKKEYTWSNYKYCTSYTAMTKYCYEASFGNEGFTDTLTILEAADDAANQNWGSNWRMPTIDEWQELIDNCTWTWTTKNNVNGCEVKASNGNSIFLPAAGFHDDDDGTVDEIYYKFPYYMGLLGSYWSSSLSTPIGVNGAMEMYLDSTQQGVIDDYSHRYQGFSVRAVYETKSNNDGSNGSINSVTVSGTIADHNYADLGLSVKWATCNVGTTKPEEYGNYYAWGETETKNIYDWNTYKYATAKWVEDESYDEGGWWRLDSLLKYNSIDSLGRVDDLVVLESADDAATANWGEAWRIPTVDEWQELIDSCTWTWGTLNGVNGFEVKASNGNSIFLPATAENYDIERGNYWSSSLYIADFAWIMAFGNYYDGDTFYLADFYERPDGYSVRPVVAE